MNDGFEASFNVYKVRISWINSDSIEEYGICSNEERAFPEEMFISDEFLGFVFILEEKYSTKIEYSRSEKYYDFFLSEAGQYDGARELASEILDDIISFFELQIN